MNFKQIFLPPKQPTKPPVLSQNKRETFTNVVN